MRAVIFRCCLAAVCSISLTGCDESHAVPLSAEWLEWADSVTAGAPFGIRVSGEIGYPPKYIVRVSVVGDTVTIAPYATAPCHDVCPAVLYTYDTLVWVPAIAATSPRTITVRAIHGVPEDAPELPLRIFGTVVVTPDTPVVGMMHAVGRASGFQDSFGCFLIIPGPPFRVYISKDQAPPWAPGFTGFAYGRVDLSLASTCRDAVPVIQIDSIRY